MGETLIEQIDAKGGSMRRAEARAEKHLQFEEYKFLVAEGVDRDEIAERLGVSRYTVWRLSLTLKAYNKLLKGDSDDGQVGRPETGGPVSGEVDEPAV